MKKVLKLKIFWKDCISVSFLFCNFVRMDKEGYEKRKAVPFLATLYIDNLKPR